MESAYFEAKFSLPGIGFGFVVKNQWGRRSMRLNGCGRIGLKTGGDAVMGTTSIQ